MNVFWEDSPIVIACELFAIYLVDVIILGIFKFISYSVSGDCF